MDTKVNMHLSRPLIALILVGAGPVGCAPDGDVVGAASGTGDSGDSGVGSGGDASSADGGVPPASAGEFSGNYDFELFTLDCSGDCSAPTLLGPISFCDIGDTDNDNVRVDQDGMAIAMDLSQGRMNGTVDDTGAFSLSGTATQGGGTIRIDASIAGGFTSGRHGGLTATIEYEAVGDYEGDAIDCQGRLEVTGQWTDDDCTFGAECPAEYPICHDDACNAGVVADPCDDPEHCADGLVCVDDLCAPPSGAGEPCQDQEHCATDLWCVQQVCSAGEPGDACSQDEHCVSEICVDDVCSTGANGQACGNDDDCVSEICVDDICSAGAPGDACTWDDECVSDNCTSDVCA